jgi:hypothetical protein
MLKNIIFVSLLTLSSTQLRADLSEPEFPSYEEQIAMADEAQLKSLTNDIQHEDYFSGRATAIQFKNQIYIVDRRSEPLKRPVGTPPPRDTISDILGHISAKTRGSVKITVKREFNENGTIKSEEWSFDVAGSWDVDTGGYDEAMSKAHK